MSKTIIEAKDVVSMSKLIHDVLNDPEKKPIIVIDSNDDDKNYAKVYIIGAILEDELSVRDANYNTYETRFVPWIERLTKIEKGPHASKYARLIKHKNIYRLIYKCQSKGIRVMRTMKEQGPAFDEYVWENVSKLEVVEPNSKSFEFSASYETSDFEFKISGAEYTYFYIAIGNFSGEELEQCFSDNEGAVNSFVYKFPYSYMQDQDWDLRMKAIISHHIRCQNQFRYNTKFHEYFERVIFPDLARQLRNFKVVGLEEKEVG